MARSFFIIFSPIFLLRCVFVNPKTFFLPSANNVNKDVFETFYLKRTSKSSHSSKSSNDSIRGGDDTPSSPVRTNVPFNGKTSSMRSDKTKPRQYLFGSTFDRKDEPEKENIYKSNQNDNSDRFKTITINSLRRSFRDTFLDSAKPAKGREHQQLWFIDVNDKRDKRSVDLPAKVDEQRKWAGDDDDSKRRVKRNETFRVDNNDVRNSQRKTAIDRRETFRIHKNPSPTFERSPSIESRNSTSASRSPDSKPINGKLVPVGVTAPYSASNDASYHRVLLNRDNYDAVRNVERNRYDDSEYGGGGPFQHHRQSSDELSSNRTYSPIRYDRPNTFSRRTGSKALIEVKPPDNDQFDYNYITNNPDEFERRAIPERQSFNDFNTKFDRFQVNRSYTSLRSNLQQTSLNNRYTPNKPSYDTVDTPGGNGRSRPKPTEPWRNISSRQLSCEDGTENRSFVPYRSNFNKLERPQPKPNDCNRTTININYNYNMNAKRDDSSKDIQRSDPPKRHTFSIPLTGHQSNSIPPMGNQSNKPKPNKNRSVNFPSVECEVRLISPNYDTKPRRRDAWKAKPVNDWTFNKVHL